jgi:FERM central domain
VFSVTLSVLQVRNAVAINLLFLEAYHNYIKCLYPCADKDATVLAGILMQLNNGDFDPVKVPMSAITYVDVSLCSL